MDKNILVATDGSKFSDAAVKEAINVAKAYGSKLYCMSVIEMHLDHYPDFLNLAPNVIEEKKKELTVYLKGIREQAAGDNVQCEVIIKEGNEPYELIINEAEKVQAGLIVVGSHGRTGLEKLLMGSVAERIIGHAKCSVLVVK
jgi:nucleotide-binding universal stress UspA family protein